MNPDTLQAMALWLWQQLPAIRRHQAAADIHHELTHAHHQAVRVIDRPPQRVYAGPCDCRAGELMTQPGRTLVTCPACGTAYGIAERLDWMRNRLEDHLGTASYAAAILPGIGIHVTDGMIRSWAFRHRLTAKTVVPPKTPNGIAQPLYRMGDIIKLALERQAARSA